MSTLSDTVESYGTDQKSMADLANSCGIGSTDAAARAYDVALPTVLDGFSSFADTQVGATLLHTLAARLSRTERDHPRTLFASRDHHLRRVVVDQVFGSALPSVQADVARAAGLGTADRLLEITSLVCLAVAAGSGETSLGIPAFVAAIGAAGTASGATPLRTDLPAAAIPPPVVPPATPTPAPLVAAPTDATFAAPSPGSTPVALPPPLAVSPSITDDPPRITQERSRRSWLLAAAAIVVLLIGVAAVLSAGDDAGDADVDSGANAIAEPSGGEPESSVLERVVAEPVPTEPAVSEPAATEPAATEPPATEPPATEPPASDPVASESFEDEPLAADGDATAVDFAGMAEDPDIAVMVIPMSSINGAERDVSGVLEASFNTITGEVCYGFTSDDTTGPYSAHIHAGDIDVQGGIVLELGQLDSSDSRCVDNLPVDTNAIVSDTAGHYVEVHVASVEWTLRGQLSGAVVSDAGSGDQAVAEAPAPAAAAQVDPDGGGAFIRLEQGTIYLEGAVADQATGDGLAGSLSNVDAGTPVVNNLVIDEDAPLPSGRIIIADAILFRSDSAQIREIGSATLVAITSLAKSQPGAVLTVVGHTDNRGSAVGNLELSLRRATASRDLLVELGVPDENLRIRGAGDTAPIADNGTLAGRELNRRIEFELAPPA